MFYFDQIKNVGTRGITREGLRKFCLGWAIVMLGSSIVLWSLQMMAGADSPSYTDEPYFTIENVFMAFLYVTLLGWIFFRDGASVISTYLNYPTGSWGHIELTEVRVKMFSLVAALAWLVAMYVRVTGKA